MTTARGLPLAVHKIPLGATHVAVKDLTFSIGAYSIVTIAMEPCTPCRRAMERGAAP